MKKEFTICVIEAVLVLTNYILLILNDPVTSIGLTVFICAELISALKTISYEVNLEAPFDLFSPDTACNSWLLAFSILSIVAAALGFSLQLVISRYPAFNGLGTLVGICAAFYVIKVITETVYSFANQITSSHH